VKYHHLILLLAALAGLSSEAGATDNVFKISGSTVVVPSGTHTVEGNPVVVKVPKSFTVDPAEIAATSEWLKLSPKKPEGFFSGTRLSGPTTGAINALASLIEDSLVIAKSGRTLVKGRDYLVSSPFALVGIGPEPSVTTNDTVEASYSYRLQRVDSIYCAADGTPGFVRGTPAVAAPAIPSVPAGSVRLANIYRPLGATEILPEHIYPVSESADQTHTATLRGRIPKTLAKIRSGVPVKIVTWGDSITVGADVEQEDAWAYAIREALAKKFPSAKFSYSNISIGGTRTVQWLADGDYPGLRRESKDRCTFKRVLAEKPDLVVMEFLNDASLKVEQVPPAYETIRDEFRAAGIEWIIITPGFLIPHSYDLSVMRKPDDRPYIRFVRQFAADNGIALADAAARWEHLWREGIPWFILLNNGFNHPGAAGHRMFVEEVVRCFE